MSFYRRGPQMGFVWLAPLVGMVSGALQSQPLNESGLPIERTSPIVPIVAATVGLGIVGGLVYILVRK